MARFSMGFDLKTTHNSPPPVKVEREGGRRRRLYIIKRLGLEKDKATNTTEIPIKIPTSIAFN